MRLQYRTLLFSEDILSAVAYRPFFFDHSIGLQILIYQGIFILSNQRQTP